MQIIIEISLKNRPRQSGRFPFRSLDFPFRSNKTWKVEKPTSFLQTPNGKVTENHDQLWENITAINSTFQVHGHLKGKKSTNPLQNTIGKVAENQYQLWKNITAINSTFQEQGHLKGYRRESDAEPVRATKKNEKWKIKNDELNPKPF